MQVVHEQLNLLVLIDGVHLCHSFSNPGICERTLRLIKVSARIDEAPSEQLCGSSWKRLDRRAH